MKSCLNFKTWFMPLIAILLMGNIISAEAQSVRVLNSNPDKGGGGIGCLSESSDFVSIYVEIDNDGLFNIDLIEIGGMFDQVTNMDISLMPPGRNDAHRPTSTKKVWKVDLTLLNDLSYYITPPSHQLYVEVTLSYGIDDGSSNPDLNQTGVYNVVFCTVEDANRISTETESLVSVQGISPNPATDRTTLNLRVSAESEVSITLMNGVGQKIRTVSGSQNLDKGEYTKEIDLSDLTKGVYYLVILMDDTILTEKILKL